MEISASGRRGAAAPQQARGPPIATGPADVVTGPAVDLRRVAAPEPSFNNHGDNEEDKENNTLDGRHVRANKGINEVNTKVEPTLDRVQSLLLVDYGKNGNTKASWLADVKKELTNMKASKDLMSRKRTDSKQWGPDTHAACQQAACRMEANY